MQLLLCLLLSLLALSSAVEYVGWGVNRDLKIIPDTTFICDDETDCYDKFEADFNAPFVEFVCFSPGDNRSDCYLEQNNTFGIFSKESPYAYFAFGMDTDKKIVNGTETGLEDFVDTFNAQCDNYQKYENMIAWCVYEMWIGVHIYAMEFEL